MALRKTRKSASEIEGLSEKNWYARLQNTKLVEDALQTGSSLARPFLAEPAKQEIMAEAFKMTRYKPLAFPPPPSTVLVAEATAEALNEGIALHALMERLTDLPLWPIAIPSVQIISRWFNCTPVLAGILAAQAHTILSNSALARFFDPAFYQIAHNEIELFTEGQLLRIDRLVVFENHVWILDYKRQLLDSERPAYRAQLNRYRQAVQCLFPDKALHTIHAACVTVEGEFWEIAE